MPRLYLGALMAATQLGVMKSARKFGEEVQRQRRFECEWPLGGPEALVMLNAFTPV
jgi:hypothetical protein